jgi:regulatory protein
MIITRMEVRGKSKVNIYLDDEYSFFLSPKEVHQLDLTEGDEVPDSFYDSVVEKIILPKAKLKALSLLKLTDRTETELRNKLSDVGFTQNIVDKAVQYVAGYGYLNDERLAAAYVRTRKNVKSKLVIKMDLLQKGVDAKTIELAFLEEYNTDDDQEDPELVAIKKAIAKKVRSQEDMDFDAKQKLIASLYRKGFNISKIKQVIG